MRSTLFTKLALAAAATAITLSPALADWHGQPRHAHPHGHHGKVVHHHAGKHKHAGKHVHIRSKSGYHHHWKHHPHAGKHGKHHRGW